MTVKATSSQFGSLRAYSSQKSDRNRIGISETLKKTSIVTDLKSVEGNLVRVRVPPSVAITYRNIKDLRRIEEKDGSIPF